MRTPRQIAYGLDENDVPFEECVVANIIGDHYWGEEKVLRSGTKHFRGGAKVYCAFIYGGMGHEQIFVMGKPRKSFRLIEVVIDYRYLKNFRVQLVYNKQVMEFMKRHQNWTADESPEWIAHLNSRGNREIKTDVSTGH